MAKRTGTSMTVRALCVMTLLLLLFQSASRAQQQLPTGTSRPRVIATTDGEQDDLASMHRFILYTNDLDVAGIVQTSSRFHHAGDASAVPPISSVTWLGSDWIHAIIRNYAAAYDMLKANDPRYPSPDYLHSVVKVGNISDVGEFAANTEGSDWIKTILLDNDPRPVYISVWGGTNVVAAALRSIRDQYFGTPQWEAIRRKVSEKAWVIIDLDQDAAYRQYIATTWPDVNVVMNNRQYGAFAYAWVNEVPEELKSYFQAAFQDTKIRKGPILTDYSLSNGGRNGFQPHDWFSEGDSPQFIQQFPVGLSDLNHFQPTEGNWGGRYTQLGPHLWGDNPSSFGSEDRPTADESPYRGASDFPPTVTVESAARGASRLRIASVTNLQPGDVVTIGPADTGSRHEIAEVGTAQGAVAKLTVAAAAGATNVKVDSVAGFKVGDPMIIGVGAERETGTVVRVGSGATSTTLSRAVAAGVANVKLGSTTNLAAGDMLALGSGPSAETVRVTTVGKPSSEFIVARAATTLSAGSATLSEATNAGAVDVLIARVADFLRGQTVRIGSGNTQEMATMGVVGVGGGSRLGLPSETGSRNVKVSSTANFLAGTPAWIDAGANLERAVISTSGPRYPAQGADQEGTRAAGASAVAVALQAGARNIKVADIAGFLVGAPITIDEGPNAEAVHISFVGTAGSTGTGIDIVETLTKPHALNVPIAAAGLTFTSGLTRSHAAGAPITANAATLTSGLKFSHASGTEIATVTPAGTLALKVASVAGFAAGKTIIIDAGDAAERATVAFVGTEGLGGTGLTLTSPTTRAHYGPVTVEQVTAQVGAVDIRLTNVPVPNAALPAVQFAGRGATPVGNAAGGGGGRGRGPASPPVSLDTIGVGDRLAIDEGANAEEVTVNSVGTSGLAGTGVSFAPALQRDHDGTVVIRVEGSGVTVSPAIKMAHAAGVSATSTGTGITLSAPISKAHEVGVETRGLGTGLVLTHPLDEPVVEGAQVAGNMNAYYPQARWTAAIQNDFAARADWQLKPYAQANHPPVVSVPSRTITSSPGQTVALRGTATDPDGNQLTYKWWQYREAGTYRGVVALSGSDTLNAAFTVPRDARAGETIHLILEVGDSGTPPLTRYQRVIVTVGNAHECTP
jgi:Protein of unknown function (DUF1593)